MKSKSFVLKDAAKAIKEGRVGYGDLIFESYWKEDKKGFIVESQPRLSEFLGEFLYPFTLNIKNGCEIFLENYFTGLVVETRQESGGVNVEAVKNKPDDRVRCDLNAFKAACHANFKRRFGCDYAAND